MTDSEKKEWEKIKAARKLYLAKAIQAESWVNLFTAAKESDLVVFWKNVKAHYKALYLQALRGWCEDYYNGCNNSELESTNGR